MLAVIKSTSEFILNTTTLNDQVDGAAASLSDGRVAAIWESQAGERLTLTAQIFNADGTKSGAELTLCNVPDDSSPFADVTGLSDGRFFVTWNTHTGSITGDIMGCIYDGSGIPTGQPFVVCATTENVQERPTVTTLTDGRFVVAWSDGSETGSDTSGFAVRAQIFNADGSRSGAEFLVNTTVLNGQMEAQVTALADGGFAITWIDGSTSPIDGFPPYAIRAQLYGPDGGAPTTDILISAPDATEALQPTIVQLQSGVTAVAWCQTGQDDNGASVSAVHVQMVAANGLLSNLPITIGAVWGRVTAPSLLALDDGRFAMSWSEFQDGKHGLLSSIFVQVFEANGITSGVAVRVNDDQHVRHDNSQMTLLQDGRILVTWDGNASGEFSFDQDIHGRIITPAAGPVEILGTDHGDRLIGTHADEIIRGGSGSDVLAGRGGDDQLYGGTGRDKLIGGDGADGFVFARVAEAGKGANSDTIYDFQSGVDHIDLGGFFAGGHFIGAAQFVEGDRMQLRYVASTGLLSGDINGDGVSDFNLKIVGGPLLAADDFLM